jgi:hypothetical protein
MWFAVLFTQSPSKEALENGKFKPHLSRISKVSR